MSVTDQYIGIPFEDQGRTVEGADCWGLMQIMYRDLFEIELPEYYISAYDTEDVIDMMESESSGEQWEKVSKPEFGDIVLMSLHPRFRDHINHVGFYVGRGRFVHTMKKTGVIIQRNNEIGCPKVMGVVRWVG